jgi:colicin import membrane protein
MDRFEISDMDINEISLVDEPANDDAKVVIVKSKSKEHTMKPTEAQVAGAILAAMTDLSAEIVKRASEQFSDNPEAATMAESIIKETVMDIEKMAKALENAEAEISTLTKRAETAEAALKAKDDEIAKMKDGGKSQAEKDEEILKSLPESIRKRLESADAEVAKAKAAEAEAIEKAAKLAAEREETEAIEKARGLKVADPEKVGKLLVRVAKGKTTADDVKEIEEILKRDAALTSSPMFRVIGKSKAVEGDPEAILKSKAEEIQKAKPSLTYAQAYDQALKENPEVYEAYTIGKRKLAAGGE